MMNPEPKNYAYIDAANLHNGIEGLGWRLDHRRFRKYLKEKHNVGMAYYFIGHVPKYANLYKRLQESGFILVFKPTVPGADGELKGNCDAELVLEATKDFYENKYDKAILVTGDGDFACLAKFLLKKSRLGCILSPTHKRCSILLKQTSSKITYLEELREKLEYKKK